jgi:hypothetical protein
VEAEVHINVAVATTRNIRHLKLIEITFRESCGKRHLLLFGYAESNDQCGGAV